MTHNEMVTRIYNCRDCFPLLRKLSWDEIFNLSSNSIVVYMDMLDNMYYDQQTQYEAYMQ